MKKIFATILLSLTSFYWVIAQQNASVSFEQFLSLRQCGSPVISPNGENVAFTVTSTDWKENGYDTEIWLSLKGEEPFQLTRTLKGSSTAPKWSPDGNWLSFLADRGDKTQIFVIKLIGGEAQAITKEEEGILNYEWSPKGKSFAFTKNEPESKKLKTTKERYGGFAFDDEEFTLSHLWMIDFQPDMMPSPNEKPCYDSKDSLKKKDCISLPKATRLTDGKFTVTSFGWSPDGSKIAFNHQPNPLINSSKKSDISIIDIASKKIDVLVKNPANDFFSLWSPDSKEILYESSVTDTLSNFYKNNRIFRIPIVGGNAEELASNFDEQKNTIDWNTEGIFFQATQRASGISLFKLNPTTNKFVQVTGLPDFMGSVSFTLDGKKLAFTGRTATALQEVYKSLDGKLIKLTNFNKQIESWNTPVSEVVKWKSKDGTEIEGVLHKPRNFDPSKKYPLLVVIHGGPTGIDFPTPVPVSVYPIIEWIEKGAIVLRPNYRGSAGYGEKFRSLNVRNLGVGDMEDVMSGVDFLEKQGFVDSNKMGCMGWSQGGYISAFLTTNTNRFKAISVGAGISNWVTYYVSTDIHPFTRQYLQANPWKDPEIYKKTSPMTNILNAKTPTLIQHGEFDRRVPISNAYELLQGLQDVGVPAQLVVYKGFGHGITKPKERLAALWHNYQWFGKYVFGENIEVPTE
ncbi:S9 family peptidase [Emticicia sp. SJ17W-69]|uniref:S9 family peptidase n=1 Tax=Emticicia sp. SJ17W-69 TaxID=3421657 RepID=UPI003EBA849D